MSEHGVFTVQVCKENRTYKIYIPTGVAKALHLSKGDEVNVEMVKTSKFCEVCGKLKDQCKCEDKKTESD